MTLPVCKSRAELPAVKRESSTLCGTASIWRHFRKSYEVTNSQLPAVHLQLKCDSYRRHRTGDTLQINRHNGQKLQHSTLFDLTAVRATKQSTVPFKDFDRNTPY